MEAADASIRRARPLLGTFVDIGASGATISAVEVAVEEAFADVATVHRLMSFHETSSDVSRLNRNAWSKAVAIHDWTYRVLETALDLNRRSAGIFDVAVAPALQELGLLPCAQEPPSFPPLPSGRLRPSDPAIGPAGGGTRWTGYGEGRGEGGAPQTHTKGSDARRSPLTRNLREQHANFHLSPQAGRGEGRGQVQLPIRLLGGVGAPISLLPNNHVRVAHRGVRIDLGGIAKGFAVDRAIETLRRHGVTGALVNAGGDLAAFGPRSHPVDIRDPRHPDRAMCRIILSNAALASSAGRFDPSRSDRASLSAVVDPLTGQPSQTIRGATVCAPSCMVADALTKVVMNAGEGAAALLEHSEANALFVSAQGCIHMTADWKNEVRFAA